MMLSLIAILLISNVKSQVDNVCVTGRVNANNLNIGVNGLYSYDTDYNGYSSYIKTTDCTYLSTVYIYRVGQQWRIGESRSDTDGWVAYCTQTDITACTTGNWYIVESSGSFELDSNIYAQADQCPTWDCASVTIPDNSVTNCQYFTTQVASNTYKTSGNYFWHYSIEFQTWFCINGNAADYTSYDTCLVSFNAATSKGWTSASSGNTVSLTFESLNGQSISTQYDVNCIGSGSNYPSPTRSPTDPTPEPTNPPIVPSTVIPTDNSYCIYGGSDTTSAINGYWEPTGRTINGLPSYARTINGDANDCVGIVGTTYLYVVGTQWYISQTEGSSAHSARCGRDTSVDEPACDSNGWYVWTTNGEVQDNNIGITTRDNCPQSSCSSISTSLTLSSGCRGPFTPLSDGTPNAFKNSAGSLYFYYIPYTDKWVCNIDLDSINSCPYEYRGGASISGFDISCDGSSNNNNNTPEPTTDVGNNDTPSPSKDPSRDPSRSPVTVEPTKAPSIAPAFCVSGRDGDNAEINGYYKSTGEELNYYSIYEKTVSGSTCDPSLYLYRDDGHWYIAETLDAKDKESYLAGCSRNFNSNFPECNGNWVVRISGDDTQDTNVVMTETTSCTSTCTGTGTNSPTTPRPTRAPARSSNNNNNNRSPTRAPQTSSNNNNNRTPTRAPQTSNNNGTPSPQTSGATSTQDNTSDAVVLCKFYLIAFSLLFGLIVV